MLRIELPQTVLPNFLFATRSKFKIVLIIAKERMLMNKTNNYYRPLIEDMKVESMADKYSGKAPQLTENS